MRTLPKNFPRFDLPRDWRREIDAAPGAPEPVPAEFLAALARRGAILRYGAPPPQRVLDRLAHELGVVEEVGYTDYFLIVWDIAREARARGIPHLARGSAADSLLCYCLRISTVCPFRFNLHFERFLNRERMRFSKLADIDLDLPWDQRDEIIEYVFQRHGRERVAMIGGFNRFHGRAALADLGKIHGLSEREVRSVTRLLPRVRADAILDGIDPTPRARELPLGESPYREIVEMARALEGVPRHHSMHPCGIVIGRGPLADLVPLAPSGRGPQMTQYDMEAVEELGLVKIDLLGQAGLSVLRDTLAALRARGRDVDLDRLDWDDPPTWDLIATGGARGVHHIESPAMTSLLVQSNCRDMDCLCAVVSVIRPGAADERKKLAFTRRHQGFEPVTYPHPSLEPHLRDTYGLLVYEEQILLVAHHFAGMNLGRADVLRRALVKANDPGALEELGREFARRALALGRSPPEIATVWDALERFHGYMFNKAHSASYAVEAYHGAWLKARHPADSLAAVLENARGFYTPLFYSIECRRLGLRLRGPCVNRSGPRYRVGRDGSIRVPVPRIAGLTSETALRWERERARGEFRSPEDLARRVAPPPSDAALLARAGALDCFGMGRAALFWNLRRLERSGIVPGAGWLPLAIDDGGQPLPDDLREPDARERAADEFELIGFPVTLHPLDLFAPGTLWDSYCPIARLASYHGETVTVCGLVVADRVNRTIDGRAMLFLTLADRTGVVEATLFPEVYARHGHRSDCPKVVAARGRVRPFDNRLGQTLEVTSLAGPRRGAPTRAAGRMREDGE